MTVVPDWHTVLEFWFPTRLETADAAGQWQMLEWWMRGGANAELERFAPVLAAACEGELDYNATGDRAYTGAERAAVISEITGKPLGFVAVPADALRGGMAKAGLPENVINTWVSIRNDFAVGAFRIVTGDVERFAGRAPKSLRDALLAALR
jgi:hypothetical protein